MNFKRWQELCVWLAARPFARVHDLSDLPDHLRHLLEPANNAEIDRLGLVGRTRNFWQLRSDHGLRLAYFAGDAEVVKRLDAQCSKHLALAERLFQQIETLDGLRVLEHGPGSRWDTDWLLVAQAQIQAMYVADVFRERDHLLEIIRAVRSLRRELRIGG